MKGVGDDRYSLEPPRASRAEFAREVAVHIAAMNPQHVSLEDIPEDDIANERRILEEMSKKLGRPVPLSINVSLGTDGCGSPA